MKLIFSTSYLDYQISCEEMNEKSSFLSFPLSLNILADYKTSDILKMMDLKIKYLGVGSYYEPLDVDIHEYYQPVLQRDFCNADHPKLLKYAQSQTCAVSWATATISAAEIALHNQGIDEKLSLEYLLTCYEQEMGEDTCDGVWMRDLREFVQTTGLMSEEEAKRLGDNMCSSTYAKRYHFEVVKPEGWNRGGLMNLVSSGAATISLMALNLLRVRYTNTMNKTDEWFNGKYSQPSVYGVVTGYDDDHENGYWLVDLAITPCEHLELKLPVLDEETGGNYAGVAGYAFGLKYPSYPTEVPTTELPTTEVPTTEVPTTPAPTTPIPTTPAPTTPIPTTPVPTTPVPTTPAPTTPVPTTPIPTTPVPTTQIPTMPPGCKSLSFPIKIEKLTGNGYFWAENIYLFDTTADTNDITKAMFTADSFTYNDTSLIEAEVREGTVQGTENCLYSLVLVAQENSAWADGGSVTIYGANGNVIFKGIMAENTKESYQLSLYSPINKGEEWKYSATVNDGWSLPEYDDSQWDSSLLPHSGESVLTEYYRRSFVGVRGMAAIDIEFQYMAGIVAYINGVEVYRDNMPEGPIDSSTPANGEYASLDFHGIIKPANVIEKTDSVLAVELHYMSPVSPQAFDAFLSYLAGISPAVNCFVYPHSISVSGSSNGQAIVDWNKYSSWNSNSFPDSVDFTFSTLAWINGLRIYHNYMSDNPSSFIFTVTEGGSQSEILNANGISRYETQYSVWFYSDTITKGQSFGVTIESEHTTVIPELQFLVCNHVSLSYPQSSYSVMTRQPVLIQPQLSQVTECTMTPSLPTGLTLGSDCTISGMLPSASLDSSETVYTITGKMGEYTVTDTITFSFIPCTETLHVTKLFKSLDDDEEFQILNAATSEVLLQGRSKSNENDYTLNTYLCLSAPIKVILMGTTSWEKEAYLYIHTVLPDGEEQLIFKGLYDNMYQMNQSEFILNDYLITDGATWSYLINEVPSDWLSVDTSSWSTGSRGSFTGPSSIQLYKRPFSVLSKADTSGIILSIRYQAGCIVYLNGNEVWRNGVTGDLSPSSSSTNEYTELKYRVITLSADSLVDGENMIGIAIVTSSIEQTPVFDAMLRLMGPDPESHIWEFTGSLSGSLEGEFHYPFDQYEGTFLRGDGNPNSLIIVLANDRREWIASVMIQSYLSDSYKGAESFSLYGRNSDTEEWIQITSVSSLTYPSYGYKNVKYFENNHSFNQFKFENFTFLGNSTGAVQSLDLFAVNVMNNFEFPSPITAIAPAELTPITPLSYGFSDCSIEPSLPSGLTMDVSSCTITGTVTVPQSITYTVTAHNYKAEVVTASFSLVVEPCVGSKGLITIVYKPDPYANENGYKVFAGRSTSGIPIRSVDSLPNGMNYYEVALCLDAGIYSLQTTDSYGDGMSGATGYKLMMGYGKPMTVDVMMMEGNEVTSVFSTYYPFELEYTDWKVIQSDVPSDWNSVSFDDSTWNTYKAAAIPSTSSITTYIRKSFTMSGVNDYQVLNVQVKYIGGVAAYLNGNLVARFNLAEDFDSNTESLAYHNPGVLSKFHVILATSGIEEGSNVFSFEIHRHLGGTSTAPVVFNATGVFGVEDCSTVVDSYSSLTSDSYNSNTLASIMNLDSFTFDGSITGAGYVEWTVENLEGSKWNSLIILGEPTESDFIIDGYYSETEKRTLKSIASAKISKAKIRQPVSLALHGFSKYRWEPTSLSSNVYSILVAYCKPASSGCPAVNEYPAVDEGELSPGPCASGAAYSYRECTGGMLGDIKDDTC